MRWLSALLIAIATPSGAACTSERFDGADFTVCAIDVTKTELRLWRADDTGAPYGSFARLNGALEGIGARLGIAMNAGMYHDDRRPVGLYIENGREEAPIVTRDGPGNFGLLPNGVFCLTPTGALVRESRAFVARRPNCSFATQSGPMLVIEGGLHPRFIPGGTSLNIRNGVGVRADGREVVFAISDEPVNFHHFGRLFRDRLGIENALYLDGRVSKLYDHAQGRNDRGTPMGPIIGTVEPLPQ